MRKTIYSVGYSVEINWLSYDEERKCLLFHEALHHSVKWITLEGKFLHCLYYEKTFGLSSVEMAVDRHPTLPWLVLAGNTRWLIYDYEKRDKVFEKKENTKQIPGVNFNPAGTELWVNAPSDNKIQIYAIDSFELKATVPVEGHSSLPIQWDPSGRWFSFVDRGTESYKVMFGKSRDYAIHNSSGLKHITPEYNLISGLTFSPDGKSVVISDDVLTVYEFPSLKKIHTINNWKAYGWNPPSTPIVITKGNKQYLCVLQSIDFHFFDLETGEKIYSRRIGHAEFPKKINDNLLIAADSIGRIFTIDPIAWLEDEHNLISKTKTIRESPEESERYTKLYYLLSIHRYEQDPEEPYHKPTIEEITRYLWTDYKIDISRNNLKTIPSVLFELEHIESLNLENNKLKEIPPDIDNLKLLKSLRLSNNQLASIPDEFSDLENLEELYLCNNPIKELPSHFYWDFGKLKTLSIYNTDIKKIPDWIYTLRRLETLTISSRHVDDMKFDDSGLASLKYVSVVGDKIDLSKLKEKYKDTKIVFYYCEEYEDFGSGLKTVESSQ